jgi:glycosyltransferase involved in cell wall biosynthesis
LEPIKLSILVCQTPRRIKTYAADLINKLEKQIGDKPVHYIGLLDNKKMTVGEKRNELIKMATGRYLTFIDDDDDISDDYINSIFSVIDQDYDCICFDCITTINDDPNQQTYSRYSKDFEYKTEGSNWYGKPAHTMIWRSEIAKRHLYDAMNYGEDIAWVVRACQDIKTEVQLGKVLYYYNFRSNVTETR